MAIAVDTVRTDKVLKTNVENSKKILTDILSVFNQYIFAHVSCDQTNIRTYTYEPCILYTGGA